MILTEIFDIVDERGMPTGATVERTRAHTEGIRHRTAHIWLVRERAGRTEVLLQKRSEGKDSFPGLWDTSSSGHIVAGDEPLSSALRELGEELGIRAEPGDLEFAGNFDIRYRMVFHGRPFSDNEVSFVYVCRRDVDPAALRLQAEEVSEVRWFGLSEVYRRLRARDPELCVPIGGLETAMRFLGKGTEIEERIEKEDGSMDLLRLMEDRYSVRSFSDRPVEEETLNAILRAGQLAPTAHNNQPQRVLVVKSPEGLEQWSRCTVCHFREQLVLITCYDSRESWKRPYDGKDSGFVDASIVTTHMMLEAANLGIGSTWIMYFDPEAVRREFGLAEEIIPVSALAMGYPSAEAAPSKRHGYRKGLKETVVCEHF